jgi:hypothetical protein
MIREIRKTQRKKSTCSINPVLGCGELESASQPLVHKYPLALNSITSMTGSECHETDENHQFLLKYDGRVDFPAVLPSP